MDFSVVIHILSFLVFLILGTAYLQLWQRKKYFVKILKLNKQGQENSFILDWPSTFLKRWCQFLDINTIGFKNMPKYDITKIRPSIWFELYRTFGIELICFQASEGRLDVFISFRKNLPDHNWQHSLEQSLNGQIPMRISVKENRIGGVP